LIEHLADPGPAVEDRFATEEMIERLDASIQQLEPSYQEIVLLLLRGMNHREISEALGIPLGTVLTRAHRAKDFLRSHLKIMK
jgi:RNA polymerase sigma-70 factor (ECF subfamily)